MGILPFSDSEDLPPADRKRRRYTLVLWGVVGVGVVALIGGSAFGFGLAGAVIYMAACLLVLGLAFWMDHWSSFTFTDEREREIQREASDWTINVLAVVGLIVWPAGIVLENAGEVTWTTEVWAVFYGWVAVIAVWSVSYNLLRHQT